MAELTMTKDGETFVRFCDMSALHATLYRLQEQGFTVTKVIYNIEDTRKGIYY